MSSSIAQRITGTLRSSWDPRVARLPLGAHASLARAIDVPSVSAFAALTGDDNPLHLDEAYAAATPYGRCISHGILYASLIPSIFGATIPGCVYVSQKLNFRKPVFVGDYVIATIKVERARIVSGSRQLVTCTTSVSRYLDGGKAAREKGGNGPQPLDSADDSLELCLDGEAITLLPAPEGGAQPPLL